MQIKSKTLSRTSKINHGFFTRKGGISQGIYSSLNCGLGSADDPLAVQHNRAIVANLMGVEFDNLITLQQTHSAIVQPIDRNLYKGPANPSGDGMVTRTPGIALGILTADCAPVLFADPENGVIGAAHAGWKGAFLGVLENAVNAMLALGASCTTMAACVGPCIAQESYQVSKEFLDTFLEADPKIETFFKSDRIPEHYLFDLAGFIIYRLELANLSSIDRIDRNTYSEHKQFYSYRRANHYGEIDYGRNLSAITLREPR